MGSSPSTAIMSGSYSITLVCSEGAVSSQTPTLLLYYHKLYLSFLFILSGLVLEVPTRLGSDGEFYFRPKSALICSV